nr:MAG TPA: hypothetical protein [Caudoviricetes sp.]
MTLFGKLVLFSFHIGDSRKVKISMRTDLENKDGFGREQMYGVSTSWKLFSVN